MSLFSARLDTLAQSSRPAAETSFERNNFESLLAHLSRTSQPVGEILRELKSLLTL